MQLSRSCRREINAVTVSTLEAPEVTVRKLPLGWIIGVVWLKKQPHWLQPLYSVHCTELYCAR